MQLAYYGAAAIKVRDYTRKDTNGKATYTPIPDWGWILETVAGVLWLIIAAISACELPPSKSWHSTGHHCPLGDPSASCETHFYSTRGIPLPPVNFFTARS